MTKLERPPCPMCGTQQQTVAYQWPGEPSTVVRCSSCVFYYLSPRPTEAAMQAIYASDTYYDGQAEDGYSDYASQEQALRLTFRRLLKEMAKRGLTGGDLLEVGCGYGYLLSEAAPYFELRHGTDFSQRAVEIASKHSDKVYQGGLMALPEDRRYDVLISNHVIEHVYEPGEFVAQLVARIKPGGVLVVSTPDMGSFWRLFMGSRWPSFKIPEHLLYFDAQHLTQLLQAGGVANPRSLPYPHAFPLALVASKLGIRLSGKPGDWSMWLPKTTLAMWGRVK